MTVALAGQEDRAFVTRRSGPALPPLAAAALSARNIRHVHIAELATLAERPDLIDVARASGAR